MLSSRGEELKKISTSNTVLGNICDFYCWNDTVILTPVVEGTRNKAFPLNDELRPGNRNSTSYQADNRYRVYHMRHILDTEMNR